jgi:hypothetical protein
MKSGLAFLLVRVSRTVFTAPGGDSCDRRLLKAPRSRLPRYQKNAAWQTCIRQATLVSQLGKQPSNSTPCPEAASPYFRSSTATWGTTSSAKPHSRQTRALSFKSTGVVFFRVLCKLSKQNVSSTGKSLWFSDPHALQVTLSLFFQSCSRFAVDSSAFLRLNQA